MLRRLDLGHVPSTPGRRHGSYQVQELVIKKYRKEDKNFEAPERFSGRYMFANLDHIETAKPMRSLQIGAVCRSI